MAAVAVAEKPADCNRPVGRSRSVGHNTPGSTPAGRNMAAAADRSLGQD